MGVGWVKRDLVFVMRSSLDFFRRGSAAKNLESERCLVVLAVFKTVVGSSRRAEVGSIPTLSVRLVGGASSLTVNLYLSKHFGNRGADESNVLSDPAKRESRRATTQTILYSMDSASAPLRPRWFDKLTTGHGKP